MSTRAVINLSTFFGTHNASFDGLNDSYCTVVWYYIILNDLTDIFLTQNMMHSYLHKDFRNGQNTSPNLFFFWITAYSGVSNNRTVCIEPTGQYIFPKNQYMAKGQLFSDDFINSFWN